MCISIKIEPANLANREAQSTTHKKDSSLSKDQSSFLETLRSELSKIVRKGLDEASQANIMEIFRMMRENLHKLQLKDAIYRQEISKLKRDKDDLREALEKELRNSNSLTKKLEEVKPSYIN